MQFLVGLVSATPIEHKGGNVYEIDRKEVIRTVALDRESAIAYAKKLAAENPGKQYAVYEPTLIFETGKPVFIEKVINDAGEIVMKPKDGAV